MKMHAAARVSMKMRAAGHGMSCTSMTRAWVSVRTRAAGMDFDENLCRGHGFEGNPMPRAWGLMGIDAAGMDFNEHACRGHGC